MFTTAAVLGQKTTAPYLRAMSCTETRFCLMSRFAIAGSLRILFLFVLICRVPECVADDEEEVAVLVVMRVVRGRIVDVALVM